MEGMWIEVQVELHAAASELVAAELSELLGGVELRDSETVFPTGPERAAVVALCRPGELDEVLARLEEVLALARAAGTLVDPVTVRRRPAHEDEWRDVWKQFFRATPIGRRFVVQPSWDPSGITGAQQVIHLDPGRAFGTGAHPSTRLVVAGIERLQEQRPRIDRFLDLGCGSGILSIVARLLWPEARGVAVDLDTEAVACTRENLARNRIDGVDVIPGSLEHLRAAALPGPFDLVMANIERAVLESLAPRFAGHLAREGRLLLSGLLTTDVEPVRQHFEAAGLCCLERADEGEWASLLHAAPGATGPS
jgi:ribosomal protein L11 methyltransferase